ncbi:MAG: hypothetical protein ABI300_01575, partial [Rhodanobacter sp.]
WRGNNRPLGSLEIVGLLLLVAGIVLWLLRNELGIGGVWAFGIGATGLLLARAGNKRPRTAQNDPQHEPWLANRAYRFGQALLGMVFVGIGVYVAMDDAADALALAGAAAFLILGGNALHAAWRCRQSWLFALGSIF